MSLILENQFSARLYEFRSKLALRKRLIPCSSIYLDLKTLASPECIGFFCFGMFFLFPLIKDLYTSFYYIASLGLLWLSLRFGRVFGVNRSRCITDTMAKEMGYSKWNSNLSQFDHDMLISTAKLSRINLKPIHGDNFTFIDMYNMFTTEYICNEVESHRPHLKLV